MNILNLFKKKKIVDIPKEDQELIKMAEEMLLNKTIRANNMGGGFDKVKLIKCTGIITDEYSDTTSKDRRVRFETDDSWIKGVSYEDYEIIKMYNNYLNTGKIN